VAWIRKDALRATRAAADVPTGYGQRFFLNAGIPARWRTAFARAELKRHVAVKLHAENLRPQAEAEQSAARSLHLLREQYQGGTTRYLQLPDTTRQFQPVHIALRRARAARRGDTAALYTVLGGGWREGAARGLTATAITPLP
jgi:hypothetical protein